MGGGDVASAANCEREGSRAESPVDGSTNNKASSLPPRSASTTAAVTAAASTAAAAAAAAASSSSPIPEATPESLKQVYKALDKRRKNLEKRKEKLAAYKVRLDAGENLNDDQSLMNYYRDIIQLRKEEALMS